MKSIICELKSLPNKRTLVAITLIMSMCISSTLIVAITQTSNSQTKEIQIELNNVRSLLEEKTRDRYHATDAIAFNKSILFKIDKIIEQCAKDSQ